jgi:hypothetical protein
VAHVAASSAAGRLVRVGLPGPPGAEPLAAYRIRPLTTRKIAALIGLANSTRNSCSKISPTRPTGIVATIRNQHSFSSTVCTRKCLTEV